MLKRFIFITMILALVCACGLHCDEADDSDPDSGADADTDADTDSDTDTDTDTDTDADNECVPAQCCHSTSCVEKKDAPDCSSVVCGASCDPGTLDCGQGFCDFIDGKCTAVIVSELSCDERRHQASAEIQAVLLENLDCKETSDCVIANGGTNCMGGCPLAVAKSGLQAYNDALAEANYKYCATFQEDGCPFATPGCLHEVPECVDKKCEMVPGDLRAHLRPMLRPLPE